MRLIVYDRTCLTKGRYLTPAWWAGTGLYRGLGRIDQARGVASWSEAFDWLATITCLRGDVPAEWFAR